MMLGLDRQNAGVNSKLKNAMINIAAYHNNFFALDKCIIIC